MSKMKFTFEDLDYQTDAVNAIVDIFEGSQAKESLFTIDKARPVELYQSTLDVKGEGITYDLGHGNRLSLGDQEILDNVRKIQERNGIEMTKKLQNKNFTIEMETGTGKTYVYIKTILELNKKYGLTKFIMVVPSLAIREGIYKSLQMTEEHFKLRYDNINYNYFIYDSRQLDEIHSFSTSTGIEIMIINIDAFRRSFSKSNTANIIHRPSEKLSGNRPIDMLAGTNPVIIIDEPQSVDNTTKSKDAIKTLNPLVTLRYSATHKQLYNLMYRLTPVDAYQMDLVKKIEVSSIQTEQSSAKPYIKLINTFLRKNKFSARAEINQKRRDGSIELKEVTLYSGDDLWEISKGVDYYEGQNYILDNISAEDDNKYIKFTNGISLTAGEVFGAVSEEAIKRAQIRETIDIHLDKENRYLKHGIKVLSLFFIDKVANYRIYDEEGYQQKGKYALWFEEEYNNLISTKYKDLKEEYKQMISFDPEIIHDGYFSVDNRGKVKDTSGVTAGDGTTYELIMKDKERLLSNDEPLRFIFTHSALKEGWDNPNVFQVCTLIETKDEMTKRQKIGRGLRLSVNQNGNRVQDHRYNVLSVIANESYKDFSEGLQSELEKESGFAFGVVDWIAFAGQKIKDKLGNERYIKQEDSKNIHRDLIAKGYLDKRGKVQKKFYEDIETGIFEIREDYILFKDNIQTVIERKSDGIVITNAHDDVEIKQNKEIIMSEEFNKLWDKIKQKTVYSIHMELDKLIEESVKEIKNMYKIKPQMIYRVKGKLVISTKGVQNEKGTTITPLGPLNEYEDMVYPDFIRRLQESTGLLRRTIIEIIIKSGKISEFYGNPESWLKEVAIRINRVKKTAITNGIQYHPIDDYYVQEEIFSDDDLRGNLNKNTVETPKKHVFDYALVDSNVEKKFAIDAENDEDVKLFAKLPNRFKIDTPYGRYNPDWVLVIDNGFGEKVYFVAETKGAAHGLNRISEDRKIDCGKVHFEILDNELKYEVVKELKQLKL